MRLTAPLSIMLLAFTACVDDENASSTPNGGHGGVGGTGGTGASGGTGGSGASGGSGGSGGDGAASPCEIDDGQCIFRHDTFGDEQLWTTALRMDELVNALPPSTALAVGLRVDATAVPLEVLMTADLEDPATTVALLGLNAIVGVRATVEEGQVVAIGVTCALCHSDVDHSVMPGVGNRLDGWPNRALDVGLIISLMPGLADYATSKGLDPVAVTAAYASWGPGRYDARFNQDLISSPVLIPPAYGLADVALETYTGDGPISYWNAYVAVTQMGAHGNFVDGELGIDIQHTPDMVTPKLPALAAYQHSLAAPTPPPGSFDDVAAAEGQVVFAARCASCHAGSSFSDAPNLHQPSAVGQEMEAALRSKTDMYRATPLRGMWHRAPYFHDGGAATIDDVITHYEAFHSFELTTKERADLVQYLLSL